MAEPPGQGNQSRHEEGRKQSENDPPGELPGPSAPRPAVLRAAGLDAADVVHDQRREPDARNHGCRTTPTHVRHCPRTSRRAIQSRDFDSCGPAVALRDEQRLLRAAERRGRIARGYLATTT